VSDRQAIEKTGKRLAEWDTIVTNFKADGKRSPDIVAFLQTTHGVPRYWARTLTTPYLKARA
jgi:hypothetical protein